MDIKVLKLFNDISKTGNISLSARRLGMTQSAASHSMKKIEKEWGIPLFVRQAQGVQLSPEAQQLLPQISAIVNDYEQLEQGIDAIGGLQKGRLVIGTYSSIALHWLPRLIREFQEKYPGIEIHIQEGNTDEIARWLSQAEVDFAFVSKVPAYDYDFIPIKEDALVAVFGNDFEIKDEWKDGFPIQSFMDYPYIASETGVDYDVANAFDSAKIQPPKRFTCKEDQTILAMVKSGLGITLLPSLMVQGVKDIQTLPLKKPVMRHLGIGILNKKQVSKAAQAFITYTQTNKPD